MTAKELSDWLRDEPKEHREYKWKGGDEVWICYDYPENLENAPCGDVFIRRNHGKWEEPVIEVEE